MALEVLGGGLQMFFEMHKDSTSFDFVSVCS